MNRNNLPRDPVAEYERLRDESLLEAMLLRREAMADFWRGADALLTSAAALSLRSAERLAQRLRRRAAARTSGV